MLRAAAPRANLDFGWTPGSLAAGLTCFVLVTVAAAEAGHVWGSESDFYLAAAVSAFAAYLVGFALLRQTWMRTALVLALAGAIQLTPLAQPLLLSQDARSYWDYGRIAAVDDGNPYEDPPSRFQADPAYRLVAGGWRDRTSTYGPLFTLISEGSAEIGGGSEDWAAWFYKALAAVAVLAATALAAALSSRPALAAAAVGWNPLFAIHFGGGGHNDAFAVALLLGGLVLERNGRRQLGGALWACAAAVKWIPLVLLPVRGALPRPRFGYLGFAVAAAAFAAVSFSLYGTDWLSALGPLVQNAAVGSKASLVHWIAAGALLFLGAYVLLIRRAWRGRVRLGLTAVALLLATPWLLPWYAIWALPLAAAEDDSHALVLAIALTGYLLVPPLWI